MHAEPGTGDSAAQKSSTGLDGNVAGLLCYFGAFVSGIAFLVLEKQSSFVRFHAMQSTFAFIALFVVHFVVRMIPLLGAVLSPLICLTAAVVWIFMMFKAFRSVRYLLPVVGKLVEEQLAHS